MAHHLAPQTAIFSPSVARAAASAAKDWAYVDGWLRSKYAAEKNRPPPSFERNPETLRALLALAAANEAADEEREQLLRVEEAALDEARAAERERAKRREQPAARGDEGGGGGEGMVVDGDLIAEDLLTALEERLSKEGRTALDAMAGMAVELGMAYPTPEALGARFVELQGRAFEVQDMIERVNLLQRYLDREAARLDAFIEELQGEKFQPAPDLAKQNLELQRKIKGMSAKLPELRQQVISLEKSIGLPSITVEEVRKDEEVYLELLAKKKELDAQVKDFAGLPPDIEAARAELEALRTELREVTERRDEHFEKLVERESPVKTRRRP
ncbi:hypothetical protein F4779DRAFT_64705 [Xylariaceae sp. FL0662B]|nr:hypothetical protein F4779DRAFT_64705 [Xylariaceae sp. FL0662B]